MDDQWCELQIVRGLQAGESDAWTALCEQYNDRVWQYVARLIGSNEAVVADVFQETLMAVAKAGRSLRDDTRIWAWLATIAHNQCALHWRQQAKRSTELFSEQPVSETPLKQLLRQEDIDNVRCLLSEMPVEYTTVLTAKYIDGLSIRSIAQQHGEGDEAIRSRLARARKEFRKLYRSQAIELPHGQEDGS